jgi:uncharacterized protein YndB with AHSA1/START domain
VITTSLDVRIEQEIAAPPEDVWAFVVDSERSPDWLDEFDSVVKESDGPVRKGTVFRYTLERGASGTFELVEWEPERRMAWDGPPLPWRGGAARPRGSFEVSDAGGGRTRLVSRFQPELSGTMVLLRPFLARWLRKQRLVDTRRLKGLLEAGARR